MPSPHHHHRARTLRSDALCALGLLALIVATWCVAYGRTSFEAWRVPVAYRGDALFLTAYLKAARDGHVAPGISLEVPELNAPFVANWDDHPRTLRATFLLAGLLARRTGLFVAINLLLLLAHVLAGLSFFVVARQLRARLEWAAAGALAFGLSHFLFWRSLDHLDLALAWHIPLCVLVVAWSFSGRGIPWGSRRLLASAAVTVVAGIHNPYYACLFGQFLLLAAAARALRRGRRAGALPVLALAGLLVATFLLDNAGSLLHQWRVGPNPGASRPYGNLERYALKPLELLIPPLGFGLADWGRLASIHWERRLYRGEGGSPYLGLVGATGLVWLAGLSVLRLLRRPPSPPPATVVAITWILAYSMLGGVNQLAGILGFLWLRGTNRFSVWILALVLLYLATRRPAVSRRAALVTALAATALVFADQVPWRRSRVDPALVRNAVAADRVFVEKLESLLPPGAMLFMMPLTEFPEGRPVLRAAEYEHLRPYLFSRQLRFSFGTDKGRAREQWQLDVAAQPPVAMSEALEACGFAGILLNRRAYPADAQELLEPLDRSGRDVEAVDGTGDYVFVRLRPRPAGEAGVAAAGCPASAAGAGASSG